MQKDQFEELLLKYKADQCTPEERALLESWYLSYEEKDASAVMEDERSKDLDEVWNGLSALPSKKTVKLWPRIVAVAVAAIAVVVFGTALWFIGNSGNMDNNNLVTNDIAPGKNGATLTLANGKKILINDALAGNIASESGVKISKTADGQIVYEVTGEDNGILTYNTLTTTRGEQTQVRLPDGTLVF